MANLITVPITMWTDELSVRCPGASVPGLKQAMISTLREFCTQSAAWVVELWDIDSVTSDPAPFNFGPDIPFYDFQAILEAERAPNAPDYPYATGDPTIPWAAYYRITDFWPWDISYIHRLSYFGDYMWDPNPSTQTMAADRFVYPTQIPAARGPQARSRTASGWPVSFISYNERPGTISLMSTLTKGVDSGEGIVPWAALTFRPGHDLDAVPVIFERQWYDRILDGASARMMSQQDKPYSNPVLAQYYGRRFRVGIAQAREMARKQMSNAETSWQYPAWA